MHNFYARFVKILEKCKKIDKDLVNKDGNIPRRGVVSKFSDLEVLSLSMTSESLGIDSEAYLFSILKGYKEEFPNLISRHRGYIGKDIQLDLFESANIKLECPYRVNQKDWIPQFLPFAKARKRIETDFSQLCDQFMIIRNYAKDTIGLFTRIIGKISAFTILQYVNKLNNRPIGEIK